MPQTYSSGVPARGCDVLLISLERCSRAATVASEENEGSPMIGGSAGPTSGPLAENRRRITSGAEEGACSAQKQAEALQCDVAEISIEDPSSSLAEPSFESFHLKHAPDFPSFTPHTGIFCWRFRQQSVRPHHLPRLFSRFCLFVQSRAAHLTPQHWLLCHLG